MKQIFSFVFLFMFFGLGCKQSLSDSNNEVFTPFFNLNFEATIHGTNTPSKWFLRGKGYKSEREKNRSGYSIKMYSTNPENGDLGMLLNYIPIELIKGKTVLFKGRVKTENVANGYACLWVGAYKYYEPIDLNGCDERSITGTTDWQTFSIETVIDSTTEVYDFGAILTGKGTAWFDNFEIYIDGERYKDVKMKVSEATEAELTWLKENIYPLKTYNQDEESTEDLAVLDQLIGNSKVVALGENTHGCSEIFQMKNRIIKYLAQNKDFDIFSIEANMPESYRLNEYIIEGKGDPKQLIGGMYFWTWDTEEMLNLVNWMKDYNSGEKKIQYTGFDMQFIAGPIDCLKKAFQGNVPAQVILETIDVKVNEVIHQVNIEEEKKRIIQDSIDKMKEQISNSSKEPDEKKWLIQNLRILEQVLNSTYIERDKYMAENFIWIKGQNPDSKFVIWAHNAHVMKTGMATGMHLSEKLGDDYLNIGFTFYEGSFTAGYSVVGTAGLKTYPAQTAYIGTFEYFFNKINTPIFVLDLRKVKKDKSQEARWINSVHEFRGVGAMKREQEFFETKITDSYDLLIFINKSTPSTLLKKN